MKLKGWKKFFLKNENFSRLLSEIISGTYLFFLLWRDSIWYVRANIENIRMTSSRIVFTYVYMALNYIHSITYCYCIWVNTRICKRPPYGQCNAIQDWNTTHTILWDYKCQAKRFFLDIVELYHFVEALYVFILEPFQILWRAWHI